jgi:hypothetical protein
MRRIGWLANGEIAPPIPRRTASGGPGKMSKHLPPLALVCGRSPMITAIRSTATSNKNWNGDEQCNSKYAHNVGATSILSDTKGKEIDMRTSYALKCKPAQRMF